MRSTNLWIAALASFPNAYCEVFDPVAALASYGIDASNYNDGAPHAAVAGLEHTALDQRSAGGLGCKYAVSEHFRRASKRLSILTHMAVRNPEPR